MLDRLQITQWDDADEDEREASLMMATARLDAEPYVGTVASTTQRLQWPRYGVPDRHGWVYSSTEIPRVMQDATCELALAILADPTAWGSSADADLLAFANLQIGSLNMTPRVGQASGALPANVLRLLYGVRSGGFQNRVVRA